MKTTNYNKTYDRTHSNTLESLFSLYLEFQVEDSNWRLSQSQIDDVTNLKKVLHRRAI